VGRVIKVLKDPDAFKVTWDDLSGCKPLLMDGTEFYHCSAVLDKCMSSVACAIELPDPSLPDSLNHVIVVDDHFFKLSENAQRFVIAHEAGHLYHEHFKRQMTDNRERGRLIKEGKVYEGEIEADAYAQQLVGYWNAVWALEELQAYIQKKTGSRKALGIRELDQRIRALKK